MFDGNILRGATGTPMRRIARAKSSLAEAEPEPLTFANLTTKSLVDVICFIPSSGGFALRVVLHAARRCGVFRQPGPAYVISIRNFCMSHAPVGQRSAHRPQCRHTSSSFAMMRPVLSPAET